MLCYSDIFVNTCFILYFALSAAMCYFIRSMQTLALCNIVSSTWIKTHREIIKYTF
uniref:Uncharacterized protein n=1 Tax=Gasterosteus aculeatus TaxID=69293 RepID=G3Q3D0_GASAC